MPTTWTQSARSAAAAVEYNDKGRGSKRRKHIQDDTSRAVWWHNTFGDRELFVRYCELSKPRRDGVEALVYRFSWPVDELPPDDPSSYDAAGFYTQAFAEEHAEGHPFDVTVHIDGESGLVHSHLVIANRSALDDSLLTTKKEITRWKTVAMKSDQMARERGMRVVEHGKPDWETERAKLQAKYDEQVAKLAPDEVPKANSVQVKTQQTLKLGDALHALREAGGFASTDEWIALCEDAGVSVKVSEDGRGWTYSMRMKDDSGKDRGRRRKASAISGDFTYDGIEARIAELQAQQQAGQQMQQVVAAAAEAEEERRRRIEEQREQVEREMHAAEDRHAIPDIARAFEERWVDEEHVRVRTFDVADAVDVVTGQLVDMEIDDGLRDEFNLELFKIRNDEIPREKRNAPHVMVYESIGHEMDRAAHEELSIVEPLHYRHALRDRTAAEEALDRVVDREMSLADAEAKAADARGFMRRLVAYTAVSFARWRAERARVELLYQLGSDTGGPEGYGQYGDVAGLLRAGIEAIEEGREEMQGDGMERELGNDGREFA